MIRLTQVGEYITIKNCTNPHVSPTAKMLVLSLANEMNGTPTIINVDYHGSLYLVHIDNVKAVYLSREKVCFT